MKHRAQRQFETGPSNGASRGFSVNGNRPLGLGICPLVLGECVQGWLPETGHFLITSPVDVFSRARFVPDPELDEVLVEPAVRRKARTAVREYLAGAELPPGGRLEIVTPMEPGLGFGTSTADITAAIRAAANAWGRAVSPATIARIAIAIEPTDGSMYPGAVAFEYRRGVLLETVGFLPSFYSLVIRTDDPVDTQAYDAYRKDFKYSSRDRERLAAAWQMVRDAVREQDLSSLARATTISARINEQLLPKPLFREVSEFVETTGIEGLIASHSGGVLGLLFDPAEDSFREKVDEAACFLASTELPWFEVSSGPVRYACHWRNAPPEDLSAPANLREVQRSYWKESPS